jgi:hypothetical protein
MSHWRRTDVEMHELPFGAIDDGQIIPDSADAVSAPYAGQRMRAFYSLGASVVCADRIFSIDGLPLYISVEVEPLVREQILDWDDTRGVVSRTA